MIWRAERRRLEEVVEDSRPLLAILLHAEVVIAFAVSRNDNKQGQ